MIASGARCEIERSPFASRTVTRHLVRGGAGLTLLIWAVTDGGANGALRVVAGLAAIAALRGCPMCWTVGLVETVAHRIRGRA